MNAFVIGPKDNKVPVNLIKCKRPNMESDHRGRTWDHGYIYIDGEKLEAWLDTTWGEYIYFVLGNTWRKVRMQNWNPFAGPQYDIDPFDEKSSQLVTK